MTFDIQGLIICGALVFFYLRRKKLQKEKVDQMSVDWEQVENFYTEDDHNNHSEKPTLADNTITPPDRNVYSPNTYNDDEYTAREIATLSNGSQGGKMTETLYLVKPSAIEETDNSTVVSAKSPIMSPVKPDFS